MDYCAGKGRLVVAEKQTAYCSSAAGSGDRFVRLRCRCHGTDMLKYAKAKYCMNSELCLVACVWLFGIWEQLCGSPKSVDGEPGAEMAGVGM